MGKLEFQQYYKRHLPHFQVPGATYFITFRLYGSIPRIVGETFIQEAQLMIDEIDHYARKADRQKLATVKYKQAFNKMDEFLASTIDGPKYFSDPVVTSIVVNVIKKYDQILYDLIAYCIMPNLVHLLLTPFPDKGETYYSLAKIMHLIKGSTSHDSNIALNRTGSFWQRESYDHVVRDDEELSRIVAYILLNPVRAKLVSDWQDWPWSYCKYPTPV